jgi:hypothetical protein
MIMSKNKNPHTRLHPPPPLPVNDDNNADYLKYIHPSHISSVMSLNSREISPTTPLISANSPHVQETEENNSGVRSAERNRQPLLEFRDIALV